jgi:hypothetical protein
MSAGVSKSQSLSASSLAAPAHGSGQLASATSKQSEKKAFILVPLGLVGDFMRLQFDFIDADL